MTEQAYVAATLRSRVVSRLSGASVGRLSSWSRHGLLQPTSLGEGRGSLRLYSWIDYCKARAAQRLLDHGLPRSRLQQNLSRLDEEIEDWYRLPLLAYQSHVIVPKGEGVGFTIVEKQSAMEGFIRAAPHHTISAEHCGEELLLELAMTLKSEGALGRLKSYGDLITMDPRICGGYPVVTGTRLETGHLAAIHEKGFQSSEEIAERYELTVAQVTAAVEFEHELVA